MFCYYSTTIDSKNIQFLHRAIISKALNDNVPITKIAKELGFSRQTIHNEIARGTIEHKKHKKAHKQEKNREKPEGGESIELRPDMWMEFGHWEIDCVVGKREGKSTCLMTIVERKTRYGITILIPKKSKKCIANALKKIKSKFGKYFYDIFKTITADNGCEFKDAVGMSLALKNGKKVKIYFAHAYHS